MKFIIDHDLHIHSHLSLCSKDEKQNTSSMLAYAKCNSFKRICVTDHYWDSTVPCNTAVNWWYEAQDYAHISRNLPLPSDKEVAFLFGCEADMDSDNVIGLPKERYCDFDFIIVSTTHFHHMAGADWEDVSNKEIAQHWIKRMNALLDSSFPFQKVGIAHPVCKLINRKSSVDYLDTLSLIPDDDLGCIFDKASKLGVGIEINYDDFASLYDDVSLTVLRVFKTAKYCGCKFYLGSDAHHPSTLAKAVPVFAKAINLLNLNEDDKFIPQ